MKRPYGKIFSVASIVAGLCATGVAFGDTMGVTQPGTGTKGLQNLQYDYNEDSGRFINSPNNPAMNPDFNLVSEVNKVDIDFMTTIVARYSLYDQTRKENFDFLNQNALFGVHMFKNGWSADLVVRFAGNWKRESNHIINTSEDLNTPVDKLGFVGIRKADVAYRFWHNKNQLMKIRLGRFAPWGPTAYDDDNVVRAWGTDATVNLWGPSGSGDLHGIYVDGVALFYQAKWGGHSRLNVEGGVASSLPIFLYMYDENNMFNIHSNPYQGFGNDSNFGLLSTNTSRAWIVDAAYKYTADWGGIQLAVDAGGKTRAEQNSFALAQYTGANANSVVANNVYYIGSSVGYEWKDRFQAGVWYHWTHTGPSMSGLITNPDFAVNGYTKVPGGIRAGEFMVYGAGMNGDSRMWGQNNVGGKDGVVTWGAGWQRFGQRNAFNTQYQQYPAGSKRDVNLYSAALGYARGPATIELDYNIFGSADNVFYQYKTNKAANYANVLYIVGAFDI